MIWRSTPSGLFNRYKPGQCQTVLVLGAGASSHLGFPLGSGLCTEIIQNTGNCESEAFKSLLNMGFDAEAVLEFHNRLKKFLPRTIDQFLAERRDFCDIGKAAIAQVIIASEDEDKIIQRDANWYFLLAERIKSDMERNAFPPLIVTFNYDLSLDKCLLDFFRSTDRHKDIKTLDQALTLLHVHGSLGQLDNEKGPSFRSYGNKLSPTEILEASQGIRVPDEIGKDVGLDMIRASKAIADAEKVIFLGFGYDPTNLERLNIAWKAKKYFGTALGLESTNIANLMSVSETHLTLGGSDANVFHYLRSAECWN